jgi:hypothetical protein
MHAKIERETKCYVKLNFCDLCVRTISYLQLYYFLSVSPTVRPSDANVFLTTTVGFSQNRDVVALVLNSPYVGQ